MNRYKIEGGHKLRGNVSVHGSKNAALPILAASVINGGKSVIHNCPGLSDIKSTIEILEILGCETHFCDNDLMIDSSKLCLCDIPSCVMSKTRSSSVFAGALAARCKKAYIASSGGCRIGLRPIDIHLDAFKSMGMKIHDQGDAVVCDARNMEPCAVYLKFPSVGATENAMLASSLTKGTTTIINAAMEPEIVNLALYLKSIGVKIRGEGTSVISVEGTDSPTDGEVSVIPDRIVASTYAIAALITGGDISVEKVIPSHFSPVIAILRKMGAQIECFHDKINVKCNGKLKNIPYVTTAPYPGFPTDAQPLLLALMSVSTGFGMVRESIFENRFSHCHSLNAMGANIEIKGKYALVNGAVSLKGAEVEATDLRCGASLCLAGLVADGITRISGTEYIDRGYEDLCRDLKLLGANIERIEQ